MSRSDSSSLSSPPTTDDEAIAKSLSKPVGLDKYFKPAPKSVSAREPSPPMQRRPSSPPHEYVIADNADIAFLVMFRSRFSNAFPKSLPHYGPQDIERGVADPAPGEYVEKLLCALLGLVLNRKKEVERGHYGRALEEAIQTHSTQWPPVWGNKNPLHGGGSFSNMTSTERLALLKTLSLWSLSASDAVQAIIKESYKQTRHEDDKNQPLSVQPWGRDGYKRNYWLIEGQEDTHWRLYRENNGVTAKTNTWFSVAGSIEEIGEVAQKLDEENTPHARTLRDKIRAAIPRFEAGEEKRKRRDYRLARKAAFARPDPGFSLYEGRTRGKRMKYTFSDDDEDESDAASSRKSTRPSGVSTPVEPAGPTVTASGRQVKSRLHGVYGETILVDQRKEIEHGRALIAANGIGSEDETSASNSRPQRAIRQARPSGVQKGYSSGDMLDEEFEAISSGNEWSGNEDEPDELEAEFEGDDEDEDMSADDSDMEGTEFGGKGQGSLVVQLRYKKGSEPLNGQNGAASTSTPSDPAFKGQPRQDGSSPDQHFANSTSAMVKDSSNHSENGNCGEFDTKDSLETLTKGTSMGRKSQGSEMLQAELPSRQPQPIRL